MPGIHIRTLNQVDWLDQGKESLLTIPGSYWLSHKKNIYKFIFRYHRTVKNTAEFSYGRELLKIIRRIIKCHPTQGQQFGTQHLLVTYNCTSWTRQDKMFAIMKFQRQTNTAAFSHAFVLTIKIFPSIERSLFDLKYPIVKEADTGTTFKDMNISWSNEEKIVNAAISTTEISSRTTEKCQTKKMDSISKFNMEDMLDTSLATTINSNFQNNCIKNSAIFHKNLDEKIGSGVTTTEMHLFDNVQKRKSMNGTIKKYERNVELCSIDSIQEQSSKIKKTDEIEKKQGIEKENTKLIMLKNQNRHIQNVEKYEIPSFTRTTDSTNDQLLIHQSNSDKKLIKKDDNDKNNLKETTSENVISPSNISTNQYEEAENIQSNFNMSKKVQSNSQTETKNVNKDCVPKITRDDNKSEANTEQNEISNKITNLKFQEDNEQHTESSMDIDDKQSEDNVHNKSFKTRKQKNKESDRKTISDKVLRSSNITDLVMEGLMFTIRQDQDSVAVIEQKTKLEMDEVLENSEKAETKAGEKCLLNSSLLRLENLVTMIDSPCNKDEHNNRHVINSDANLSPFNAFSSNIHNININHVDSRKEERDSNVFNHGRYNAMNHLSLYPSQWQHQHIPSIENNDNCSEKFSLEKYKQSMEWQRDDSQWTKGCKDYTQVEKEKEIVPEISSSKNINAELQDTKSSTMENIEEMKKCDKSTEEYCNSFPPSNSNEVFADNESSLVKLSQQEANMPKIVSYKSITVEQMSPALQKILQRSYRPQKVSSTTSSAILQQDEKKIQHTSVTADVISEMDVLEDKYTDSNVADTLSTDFIINSEKEKNDNEISCTTVDEDVSEIVKDTHVKSSQKKNDTHHILRRSSSSKHGFQRKLQDITEEFYYDLLHVHKNNSIRQRCLKQKQRSLNNLIDKSDNKMRIEMLKFIRDITEGVKVVVRRLNIDNKSNLLEKNLI